MTSDPQLDFSKRDRTEKKITAYSNEREMNHEWYTNKLKDHPCTYTAVGEEKSLYDFQIYNKTTYNEE